MLKLNEEDQLDGDCDLYFQVRWINSKHCRNEENPKSLFDQNQTKKFKILVVFQLVFQDPQELLDLFAKLEAENLSLIQECQEAEVLTNHRPVFRSRDLSGPIIGKAGGG